MKTLVTTLTERGQVSVPAQIRKQLHLNQGQHLVWEYISDHECRILVTSKQRTIGAVAMLGYAKRFRTPRRTSEWITELREGDL